jgi:hypothetical protein
MNNQAIKIALSALLAASCPPFMAELTEQLEITYE